VCARAHRGWVWQVIAIPAAFGPSVAAAELKGRVIVADPPRADVALLNAAGQLTGAVRCGGERTDGVAE
jgi:hypothetical protein